MDSEPLIKVLFGERVLVGRLVPGARCHDVAWFIREDDHEFPIATDAAALLLRAREQ